MIEFDCPNYETCGGFLKFRLYQDSDGDASLPWTVGHWTEAEYMGATCACDFTPEELEKMTKDAIDASGYVEAEPWLDEVLSA